jgi:putative membrane protein
MEMRLILRWALNAVALMLLPELITDLRVDGYAAALISALLLGLVNALIRPLLILVTLPITVLTLGLFTLVINALLFWLVSNFVAGFHVPDFSTAFWGALVYSLLTWLVSLALADDEGQRVKVVFRSRRD